MALYDRFTLPCGTEIALWEVTESEEELSALFAPYSIPAIPAERHRPHRRCEFLAARLLLIELLQRLPEVVYSSNGKPSLVGGGEISISHTAHFVAVAYHPCRPIGIDIEQGAEKAARLKERFLSVRELVLLALYPTPFAAQLAWSGKESLYKVRGVAGVDFRADMHFLTFSDALTGRLNMGFGRESHMEHYTLFYRSYPAFMLTLAMAEVESLLMT